MAARTHVWLLEQASPGDATQLQPWLMRRLADPGVLPLPFAWLRLLVAWVLVRLRLARLQAAVAALPGPAPESAALPALAAQLQRQLGHRYRCQPVLRLGRPDATSAAAELRPGEQVVLLPVQLIPDNTGLLLLADARAALAPRRARLAEVRDPGADGLVLDALCRGVRRAILDLPRDLDYAVLFCAFAQGRDEALGARLAATRDRLVAGLRLDRPHQLLRVPAFGLGPVDLAALEPELDPLTGRPAVVLVPLGPLTPHGDVLARLTGALQAALLARGVGRVELAQAASEGPLLARGLARLVRQAERGMEWEVPEDGVLAAVEAELSRRAARRDLDPEAPHE